MARDKMKQRGFFDPEAGEGSDADAPKRVPPARQTEGRRRQQQRTQMARESARYGEKSDD